MPESLPAKVRMANRALAKERKTKLVAVDGVPTAVSWVVVDEIWDEGCQQACVLCRAHTGAYDPGEMPSSSEAKQASHLSL